MSDKPITEEQARAFASHPKIIELNTQEMLRTRTQSVKEFMRELVTNLELAKDIGLKEGKNEEVNAHISFMTTLVEVLHEVTGEPIPTQEELISESSEG